jgi:hypothetical protein
MVPVPSGVVLPSGVPVPSGMAIPEALPSGSALPSGVPSGNPLPPGITPPPGYALPSTVPSAADVPTGVPAAGPSVPSVPSSLVLPSVVPSTPALPSASSVPSAGTLPSSLPPRGHLPNPTGHSRPGRVGSHPAPSGAATPTGAGFGPGSAPALAACKDSAISVMAQVGATSYRVGQRPRFQLMVTNIGSAPCTRDLNPWLQELVVTGPGQARLWSSNDCTPTNRPDLRTLVPGAPVPFSVEWQGRTSAPGCGAQRTAVGPGSYALVAKLGSLSSGPAPFTLLK